MRLMGALVMCALVMGVAVSALGCGIGLNGTGGTPLEPEQTFVLPDQTMTVEVGGGARAKSKTYPRIVDDTTKGILHAGWRWGVTDRLTLALPIPLSGSFLLREGARSQTSAQWNLGGGIGFTKRVAGGRNRLFLLTWSAGLTELVMLGPNAHLAVQFGGGTLHTNTETSFRGDGTIGLMLRLGGRVRIHPAVQGYRDWTLDGLPSEAPFGRDGVRIGGVLDRGRDSVFARQPLILVHLLYGFSLFENSTFDFRQGRLYEQSHVAGIRWRF